VGAESLEQHAAFRLGLAYGALIHRLRFVVPAAWLVVLAVALPFAGRTSGVLTSSNPAPAGSESARAEAVLTGALGQPRAQAFVVLPSAPDADLAGRIHGLPDVTDVSSAGTGGNGRTSLLVVSYSAEPDAVAARMGDLRRLLPAGAMVTGAPAVADDFNRITAEDVARADGIALPVALVVLLIVFGSLIAAPLPLLLAVVAVLSALAGVYAVALRMPVDAFVLNIVSIIGLGASIDYSLLLVRRFREELGRRDTVAEAVAWTVATAGESILLGGLTVAIGFAGLLLVGVPVLRSLALGGILVIAASVLAALTLLPAVLGLVGRRMDLVRLPWAGRATSRGWRRWAWWVMGRPGPIVAVVVLALLALAGPVLGLNVGSRDATGFPPGVESRRALEVLRAQFPGSDVGPVRVVVRTRDGSAVDESALASLTSWLGHRPSVTGAFQEAAGSGAALITVRTAARLDSDRGRALVDDIRAGAGARAPGLDVMVGGQQAVSVDFTRSLYARFPLAIGFVLAATYLLLLAIFRSALLPLKAVLMNALSVGAAYGVLVAVFQWGLGSAPLGFDANGLVDHLVPVLLFCVLFGLSMDYEVFLLSRIREAWLETGDNRRAVAIGLERTGGVITSAALLFCVVTTAFVFTRLVLTKELGVGITMAVLVDAIAIRSLLVPATMCLLGRWNWWLPGRPPPA
jgi:uncharacterized membrane protein YdfJ with MMPL/SSD domain